MNLNKVPAILKYLASRGADLSKPIITYTIHMPYSRMILSDEEEAHLASLPPGREKKQYVKQLREQYRTKATSNE